MWSQWIYPQPIEGTDADNLDEFWNIEWGSLRAQRNYPHQYHQLQGSLEPVMKMPFSLGHRNPTDALEPKAFEAGRLPAAETDPPVASQYLLCSENAMPAIETFVDSKKERSATDATESTVAISETLNEEDAGDILPSVGSSGHADGSCKRCTFFPKGKCKNGFDCGYCHFEHDPRKRHRRRRGGGNSATQCPKEYADDDSDVADEDNTEIAEATRLSLDTLLPEKGQVSVPLTGGRVMVALPCRDVVKDETEFDTNAPSSDAPSSPAVSSDSEQGAHNNDECTISVASACTAEVDASDSSSSEGLIHASAVVGHITEEQKDERMSKETRRRAAPVDIARRARAILNKLTAERFERLYVQVMALPLETPEQLSALVAEIFHTATAQSHFLPLYAELCSRIDGCLAPDATRSIGGKAFRRALVNECQASFERNLQDQDVVAIQNLNAEERYEAEVKFKTQMLGNMRFIGELLVRRLLATKMLLPILGELLGQGSEAAIESLVALITVVAPHFENGPLLCAAPLKEAFAALKSKTADRKVSARVRFQIRDMLDLRARGWQKRAVT